MAKKHLLGYLMTNDLLRCLKRKEQRGSKPRCHLLTHGSREEVATRFTGLIQPWGRVDITDRWMPQGFADAAEAQLGRVGDLVPPAIGQALVNWWLAVPKGARVPHWDIASNCTVEGKPGLLLIEAKAHDEELIKEEAGKKRERNETSGQRQNREQIRNRMQESNSGLANSTQLEWALSIEHHYQMSNCFVWAWKLTELGIPVILIYLGFLNAIEMIDRGVPFYNHESWQELVLAHSVPLFSNQIWNSRWIINRQPFVPLIKSIELPLVKDSVGIADEE
jgi:hypothetical protein